MPHSFESMKPALTSHTLYIADDGLGVGVFPRFDERLQLTNPGATRSECRLSR